MENPPKWLQPVLEALLVTALVGCTVPATPHAMPTSTDVQTPKISATSTQVLISSFEECAALGNPIQNTYPRRCISARDEVFTESLEDGILFSQTYGDKGEETPHFITLTKDRGYLLTASIYDDQCLILKLNVSREKEWESVFGQELREEFQWDKARFRCWSARQTSDGGYVIMGTASDESVRKSFLLKLDRNGEQVSSEIIPERKGKFAHLSPAGEIIWLNSFNISSTVVETSEGGYALVGTFPNGVPDSYTHLIKTDGAGTYLWEKNLCLDKKLQRDWQKAMVCSRAYFWEAIQSQDGGYVLTGGSGNRIGLVKTDASGNIEWLQSYSGSAAPALLQTADGGFLIAGQRRGNGILLKAAEDGDLEWTKSFGGIEEDTFTALEHGANGEIIVLASTKSFGEGLEDIWLLGIDITILK
jgi:hypothetical protein